MSEKNRTQLEDFLLNQVKQFIRIKKEPKDSEGDRMDEVK